MILICVYLKQCAAGLHCLQRNLIGRECLKKKKFQSYLEIGVQNGVTYSAVKCNNKIGIDPAFIENYPHIGLAKTTSDDYFKNGCGKFDIVFIDGLHTYEQIKRDLNNSYNHLT